MYICTLIHTHMNQSLLLASPSLCLLACSYRLVCLRSPCSLAKNKLQPSHKTAKGELSAHTPVHTKRRTRRTAEATSPTSSLIPTQVLVVPLLLVLVLLAVLYLRVPNGNTEEPAQTSLRSVSVLILDLRSSIPREMLQAGEPEPPAARENPSSTSRRAGRTEAEARSTSRVPCRSTSICSPPVCS